MNSSPERLSPPIDLDRDHILGPTDAELTLVEYGSYACRNCHAVHDVVEGLRSRFGERMRYVFRHSPVPGSNIATEAAELAEYAAVTGQFWEVHEVLMERGPALNARINSLPAILHQHRPLYLASGSYRQDFDLHLEAMAIGELWLADSEHRQLLHSVSQGGTCCSQASVRWPQRGQGVRIWLEYHFALRLWHTAYQRSRSLAGS